MASARLCPNCMTQLTGGEELCPNCGKPAKVANKIHHLPVGVLLNSRYLVGAVIGEGGFGITYVGYDVTLGLKVAIKEYYPNGVANRLLNGDVGPTSTGKNTFDTGMDHFLREAEILSGLAGDDNVVTLRDFFKTRGTAYIVMEFLEGQDLRQVSQMRGRLSYDEAMRVLEPVINCLGRIHEKGLIHGDISPSNIMLLRNGQVKILDFGTARAQGSSVEFNNAMILKPGYAAEELYRLEGQCGTWTDVYSISATLYMLLTGVNPEEAPDRLYKDQLKAPTKCGAKLNAGQERALMKGMALKANERTQTMAQLLEELKLGAKRRLLLGKSLKTLGIAAAALAVVAAIVMAPKGGTAQAGKEATEAGSASTEKKHPGENKPTLVELRDDAYAYPLYAGMEPVESFKSQVIADNLYYTIRATDCFVGNGTLCIFTEFKNISDAYVISFSGFSLYPDGDYSLSVTMERTDGEYSVSVPPGETASCAYVVSTDELLLKGIRTLRGVEISPSAYTDAEGVSLYNAALMEPYIDFGEILVFDREEDFDRTTIFEGDLFGQNVRIDCLGASLIKDHYTGKLFFECTLTDGFNTNGYTGFSDYLQSAEDFDFSTILSLSEYGGTATYLSFNIKVAGESIIIDDQKLYFDNSSSMSSHYYLSKYSSMGFDAIDFAYGYSAARDEMNVLHSGLAMPKTVEIELIAVYEDYEAAISDTVELGTITLQISENGVGIVQK